MAKKRPKHSSVNLPGSFYQRNRRWWWKIQMPGEEKIKARPLKPVGSRYATTDYAVATECARQLLQEYLFKKDVPLQGDVRIIPDLVRAYMAFAKEYCVDPEGKLTQEPVHIKCTLEVLLDCFPALPVDEFGPLRLKEVREVTGALASRFNILVTTQTFLGREGNEKTCMRSNRKKMPAYNFAYRSHDQVRLAFSER